MSDTFRPGLAHLVAATGERVHRAPYTGTTDQQHATSLRLMVEKIREGYKDRRIRERVGQVLHAAGIDGRKGATTRQVVGALLEYLRAGTVYVPDPVKTEYVQGAAATLCLAPGLCMRGGDCDDLVVALCCLVLAAGIPCSVVKESYGADPFSGEDYQGHVLCAIKDEHGEWFYADPSTTKPVEDRRQQAVSRQFIDPLANTTLEIVGVGRPHVARVWEDQEVAGFAGFGAVTAGTTQIPGTWTNVASNTVVAGLRYAVAVAVSAVATPAVPAWTADNVTSYFSKGGASPVTFLVEQVIPGSTNSSWIMIGLARSAGALPATSTTVNVVAVLQEQPAAAVPAPTSPTGPTSAQAALVAPTVGSVSMGTALLWGLGIAAAGGIVWGLSRRRGGL